MMGKYFRPEDLILVEDESTSWELPPQTRRFLVARFPNGSTLVQEVPVDEEQP